MAGIFDFLTDPSPAIPDAVKDRRLMDWQNSTTQAGDDALKNRVRGMDLAADRAAGQGSITAERQAAQKAGIFADEAWRRSAGAATGAEAAGLLGRGAASVAKGLASPGLGALTYSADVGEGSELTQDQIRKEMGPANAFAQEADAARYAQRVQANTGNAVDSLRNAPVNLMAPTQPDADSPQDIAAAQSALKATEAPPVEATPVGPAVQANPVTTQQAAAQTQQQTEAHRQTIEQGALKGLSTGAVSRPKVAEAVVEADLQRSEKELTPEAKRQAVTAELKNMKSMDNEQLSKYLSYALIAGGVLAVLFDKSGRAAEGFNQGFNKQLDRNLQSGLQAQKMAQAQIKLNQDMMIQQGNWKRTDRGLDQKDTSIAQTGKYNEGRLNIAERGADVDEGRLGLARQSEGRQAAQGAQGLSIRSQALSQRQAELEYQHGQDEVENSLNLRRVGQGDTANAIRAAGVAKAAAKVAPGVPLTEKGAEKVVSDFADQQGVKIDSGAASGLASQVQQASKNDPRWKTNPALVLKELVNNPDAYESTMGGGVFGFGQSPRIKQKK